VAPAAAALIEFAFKSAVWDPNDTSHARETEPGEQGHFDFPFTNLSDQQVELGMLSRKCDCTILQVCVVERQSEWEEYHKALLKQPLEAKAGDWAWTNLKEGGPGFTVPARAKGVVRMGWDGRKRPGTRLNLAVDVWYQPVGDLGGRQFDKLDVPIVTTVPLRFAPLRVDVGTLGPRDSETVKFTVWSATRDALEFQPSSDPLFEYTSKPFTPAERANLEKDLRGGPDKKDKSSGESTRIRSVYHFQVKVNERAGGKQMDQGPFYHDVVFLLEGNERFRGPKLTGVMRGDVSVDSSKIDFDIFRAKDGKTRAVVVWTDDPNLVLDIESQLPRSLVVKLTPEGKVGGRGKWRLQVTVPPDTFYGSFTDEHVITLQTKTEPPRKIRIPLAGNAQS
jgi:hypothetical protein